MDAMSLPQSAGAAPPRGVGGSSSAMRWPPFIRCGRSTLRTKKDTMSRIRTAPPTEDAIIIVRVLWVSLICSATAAAEDVVAGAAPAATAVPVNVAAEDEDVMVLVEKVKSVLDAVVRAARVDVVELAAGVVWGAVDNGVAEGGSEDIDADTLVATAEGL